MRRGICFRLDVLGQRPGLAGPAQSDRGAESADDDAIHLSQQYARQDHEGGGCDAKSKYSYRPTKDVRSFGEIVTHVADISYFLCSKAKGEANPAMDTTKGSKTEIVAYLKGSFDYCDRVYSGFTDAHLNDPADFFGDKTNKMFILTQAGNHDALHYGNLVTYMRLNGLEPSGGWF